MQEVSAEQLTNDDSTADNLFKQAAIQDEVADKEKRLNKIIDLMIGVKGHERLIASGFRVEYTGYGFIEGASGRTSDRRSDGSSGKGDSE